MTYSDLNKVVSPVINLSEKQRLISGISGGLLLAMGIFGFGKSSFRRAIRMTAGSLLIMRGVSGYCPATAMHEENCRKEKEELALSQI